MAANRSLQDIMAEIEEIPIDAEDAQESAKDIPENNEENLVINFNSYLH